MGPPFLFRSFLHALTALPPFLTTPRTHDACLPEVSLPEGSKGRQFMQNKMRWI